MSLLRRITSMLTQVAAKIQTVTAFLVSACKKSLQIFATRLLLEDIWK